MGIQGKRKAPTRASEEITSSGLRVILKAAIIKIDAAVGLFTKYYFNDAENFSNLHPKNIVTMSGNNNTENDGDFEIYEVSDTPGSKYLIVYNSIGIADAATAVTAFCTYILRKNLIDTNSISMSGLVPEPKDAVECSYDISGNLTQAVFYKGGLNGTKICEINLTYDISGNMLTVERV